MTDLLSTISVERLNGVLRRARDERLKRLNEEMASARAFLSRPLRGHASAPWPRERPRPNSASS